MFIQQLRSQDNQVRKQAEEELKNASKTNPSQVLNLIMSHMASSQDVQEVEFVSLVLTRSIFDDEENFKRLQPQDVELVIKTSLAFLQNDNKLSFLKRMCDMIVKVLLKFERYDEMVATMLSIANAAKSNNQKIAIMYYVEIMCEFALDDDLLMKNSSSFNNLFTPCLNHADPQVRVAALKSMTIFLAAIEAENVLMKFQNVCPLLIEKCVEAIQIEQESAVIAIQSLNELLELHPKFMKNSNASLLDLFTQVISSQLSVDLRKAALHGLQTLSQQAPAFIRKSDVFKQQTILAIMKCLATVDNPDWESNLEDNCLQVSDLSSAAEDCLGKMIKDLTNKFLLPLFVPLIMQALRSTNWMEQHSGLIALSTLCEGAKENFLQDLPNLIQMISPMAQSSEKRIIYDLMTCFAMLCQEFSPEIQQQYGGPILQITYNCIVQTQSQKLQFIGLACLVDFSRELLAEDKELAKQLFTPVAQQLVEALLVVIQQNLKGKIEQKQQQMSEQALSAFSLLSQNLPEYFTQHYDTIAPFLINQMQVMENKIIKNLMIECIGCILCSISQTRPAQFKTDVQQLMVVFMESQNKLEFDDQLHQGLFFFYTQVASQLKHDFGPYLEFIFPMVEKALRIDVGFAVNDDKEETNQNVAKVKLDLKFIGIKSLSLNTSALEQKIEGANTLAALAEYCGKSFMPYVPRCMQLVTEFIAYRHSTNIQQKLAQCIPYMLMACSQESEMVTIMTSMAPLMIAELDKFITSKQMDRAAKLFEQLAECVNMFKHASLNIQLIEQILVVSFKGIQSIQKEKSSLVFEDQEQFEQDCEEIDEMMGHITNIVTEIIKYYPVEQYYVSNLMPEYIKYFNQKSTSDQIINSISFFNNVLPLCQDQIFNQAFPEINKYFQSVTKQSDLSVKQNVLYGYGNFSKRAQNMDSQLIINLAQEIIAQPDIKSSDNLGAYETALTTLGKLGMYQTNPNSTELVQAFLNSIPHSASDAQETHLMLLKEIQSGNQNLLTQRELVVQILTRLRDQDSNNPENELLCDQGRLLINQILG